MKSSRTRRTAAVLGALALVATACAVEDDPDDAASDTGDETEEPAAADEIAFDVGVTEDACPDAVNPDNGCIYLGTLSDLSEGPFAPLAVHIVAGQEAFWQKVNEDGGIAGFDVDVSTYTRDTLYDPQQHSARYREIEPNILALVHTLGTETTEAILGDMDSDNVIGAPASWIRCLAPVSRSTMTATATTSAPASRNASTAASTLPPVVDVSSTASTRRPETSGPSIRRWRPCCFSALRTTKASSVRPRAAAACSIAAATGSAPKVNPPAAT